VTEIRNPFTTLIGKPAYKRVVENPKCRWQDNIKLDLELVERESVDWI
jgi:hypothetical protein